MAGSRSRVVSSFTIIKGSLIEETYVAFREWDWQRSKAENLQGLKDSNAIGAKSTNWLRDVAFVISRRFDPERQDCPLVELAQAGCDPEIWKPILLWHMTRDEFLARDFLVHWLYSQYHDGIYRLRPGDVVEYLDSLDKKEEAVWSGEWTDATTARVASGLLRIATDFGLLSDTRVKEFTSYHLPEASFLYLLHAVADIKANARDVIEFPDWRLYRMDPPDVERELLRLHQFRTLHYERAGSLAQLKLPCHSAADFARTLCP